MRVQVCVPNVYVNVYMITSLCTYAGTFMQAAPLASILIGVRAEIAVMRAHLQCKWHSFESMYTYIYLYVCS